MSHSFQVPDDLYTELATYAARRGQSPDVLFMDLVKEGVEQLKQTDSMAALRKIPYDPAHDPLAPFIGAFDSGNDEPGWIERHDEFFAGRGKAASAMATRGSNFCHLFRYQTPGGCKSPDDRLYDSRYILIHGKIKRT